MNKLFQSIKQLFCSHVFHIGDMPGCLDREGDGSVSAKCSKCNKLCFATHGLALPGPFGPQQWKRNQK